ncbi:MAG: hypothetical protein ACMXYK_01390 [Candidatus Woesearchaeota archaeon]
MTTNNVYSVDLDDFIFPFNEGFITFVNAQKGTSYTLDDLHDFRYDICLGGHISEWIDLINAYVSSDDFRNIKPYPEAVTFLNELSKKGTIIACSARSKGLEEVTAHQLRQTPQIKDFIHTLNKAGFLKSIGVKTHFDDAYHNVRDVHLEGIRGVLLHKNWNDKFFWVYKAKTHQDALLLGKYD